MRIAALLRKEKERSGKEKPFHSLTKGMDMAKKAVRIAAVCVTYGLCRLHAFAMSGLDKTYTIADTTNFNPESMILNLAFWISRLVGIGMLVWGIYGYVTARKDGEAESMNGALGKLISGCVLIAMPSVMKGLGILS